MIVTGDLVFPMGQAISLNNRAPIMQFASFMRNIGIPWAFTYGNHDTEEMSVITDEQFGRSDESPVLPKLQKFIVSLHSAGHLRTEQSADRRSGERMGV